MRASKSFRKDRWYNQRHSESPLNSASKLEQSTTFSESFLTCLLRQELNSAISKTWRPLYYRDGSSRSRSHTKFWLELSSTTGRKMLNCLRNPFSIWIWTIIQTISKCVTSVKKNFWQAHWSVCSWPSLTKTKTWKTRSVCTFSVRFSTWWIEAKSKRLVRNLW